MPERLTDEELAAAFYDAVNHWSNNTERSQQSAENRIGVSDLGLCSEKVRRKLNGEIEPDRDAWQAFLGTWVGEGIEEALKKAYPDLIIQSSVTVKLAVEVMGQTWQFNIPGHPDMIFPSDGLLLDNKGTFGLAKVTKYGMSDRQKRFQRHLYAKAAHEGGLFGELPLSEVRVGNVWHDRSGEEKRFLVRTEPFDEGAVSEASEWLGEVVYNFIQKTDAPKEPDRHSFCQRFCGFFDECRAGDTDVTGPIRDPNVLHAVEMYLAATEMERRARNMKASAQADLKDVHGMTPTHSVRWIHIGPAEMKAFTRAGYDRLAITKAPKPKGSAATQKRND